MLIRSTLGSSEPRFQNASKLLRHLGLEVTYINWARSNSEDQGLISQSENLFKLQAQYGDGVKNYVKHLRFLFFVFQALRRSRPMVIYACDLDTFLPSLIYSKFNKVILIFDQFDPLSARVGNSFFKRAIDLFENLFARGADLRITANLQRHSKDAQQSWLEIRNLFPIKVDKVRLTSNRQAFLLFYGGILSYDRGLLESANVVGIKTLWRMDIFGQGAAREALEQIDSKKIVIHNPISHQDLMERAQSANLYLAMYDPSIQNNRLTASNKLFEAAQLGIPLLTSKGTHIGDAVQEHKLGWVVTYGNLIEIEEALDDCAGLSKHRIAEINSNLAGFYQRERERQNSNIQDLENRITTMLKFGRA